MGRLLTRFLIPQVFVVLVAVIVTVGYLGLTQPVLADPAQPRLMAGLFSLSGTRPGHLGVEAGQLTPCPESPNCVSSQSSDTQHQIEPLTYGGTPIQAYEQLKMVVETLDHTEVIADEYPYLYAEFTTTFFGFVDDVEFYIDPNLDKIQVRSASRLGESDLGLNRRRVETIRAMFESFNS